MAKTANAIVLLSGGMDSAWCAAEACAQHGAANVACCMPATDSGRNPREARAFREIADFYGVTQRLMVKLDHFRAIGGSALTDGSIAVPENGLSASGGHGSEIPVT